MTTWSINSATLVLTTSITVSTSINVTMTSLLLLYGWTTSSPDSLSAAKKEIASEFEATDQGDPRLLLGIEIARNRNVSEIKISQGQFLHKILSRFNMEDSHPVSTPMENSNHLTPASDDDLFEDPSLYRAAVGSLMYAAVGTRPDLTFAVQKLAQFSHKPSNEHWKAIKHVLRYVKGTLDLGITYSGAKNANIVAEGFSDADWASNRTDRKSFWAMFSL